MLQDPVSLGFRATPVFRTHPSFFNVPQHFGGSNSARTSSGSCTASASAECFQILFLQDFAPLHSSGNAPISPMFLNILGGRQRWLTSSSGTVFLCILTNTSVPQPFCHQILQNLKGGTRCTYNLPLFGDLMTIRLKLQRDKINIFEEKIKRKQFIVSGYRDAPPEDMHVLKT